MNVKITRDWIKSFFVMIVAVIIMGMCVSLLVMCDMGTDPFNMNLRIGILIPALILFILAAAIYMQSGHGTAPYDAVSFLISDRIEKRTGKNMFRIVRIIYDLVATCIGVLTGGEVGVITILMVILLGPTVDLVGKLIKSRSVTERSAT